MHRTLSVRPALALAVAALLAGCGESGVTGPGPETDEVEEGEIPWELLQGRLVVTNRSGYDALFLDARDRTVRTVARGVTGGTAFALSPDGTRLAFAQFDFNSETGTDLRVISVGSEAVICPPRECGDPLVVTEEFEWGPAWSDDGRVAYAANRGGDGGVYVDETRIHPEELYTYGLVRPDWAPDGTVVMPLYTAGRHGLYRLDPESGSAVALIEDLSAVDPTDQDWTVSPDGTRLAFTRYGVGRDEETVWVSDLDGGNPRQLASGARPIWSPDGARLAYQVREELDGEVRNPIYLVDVDGGTPTRVLDDANLWDWR